jgi:hypothetical protein
MRNICDHNKIVTALGGEVEQGKCRCPICGGKLSVKEKGGKILLKCWGGCDNNTRIIPWLRERGAWGSPPHTNGQDDKEQETVRRVRKAKAILKAARKANLLCITSIGGEEAKAPTSKLPARRGSSRQQRG